MLTINGKEYPVLESYANPDRDLAILIVPNAPCPCAYIRRKPAQIDERIILVGYPHGLAQTIAYGQIQGRVGTGTIREQLVTSALGAPGKSGGGVFDINGSLLAIATQMGPNGLPTFAEEITPVVLKEKGSL